MAEAKDAVDWAQYFEDINSVCPWSKAAWANGRIDIVIWRKEVLPLDNYLARVYLVDLNPRRLKKLANQLEEHSEIDEWLWSHPRYKGYSAPVPILIQQNRAVLEQIRTKISQ